MNASPSSTPSPTRPAGRDPSPLLVACLCAEWCRTCDTYRDTLAAVRASLQASHPDAVLRFQWIDIEDESNLLGDLDIEDFPTILLARDDRVLFFGPVMPHAQTLERLVRNMLEDASAATPPAGHAPDVLALPGRLRERPDL